MKNLGKLWTDGWFAPDMEAIARWVVVTETAVVPLFVKIQNLGAGVCVVPWVGVTTTAMEDQHIQCLLESIAMLTGSSGRWLHNRSNKVRLLSRKWITFIASESGAVEQVFSRSLERILILVFLWYKARNWPPLLILSGASRPRVDSFRLYIVCVSDERESLIRDYF